MAYRKDTHRGLNDEDISSIGLPIRCRQRKSVSHGQIDPTRASLGTHTQRIDVRAFHPTRLPAAEADQDVAVAGDPDIVGILADRNRFPGRERSRVEDSAPAAWPRTDSGLYYDWVGRKSGIRSKLPFRAFLEGSPSQSSRTVA